MTSYTYDEVGNRLTQADANAHTTSYQYDQRGRRTQRKLPLGQSESYAYHGNGNMSAKTDFNGKTTTYTYDSMNRLLSKIPDASFSASPVTFTYTGAGQRSTMNDASGATSYGYDSWHRPAFKNTPAGQSSYGVDAAGNLTSQSVGSYTSFYGHDALNRLSTVTVQFYFTDSTATYGYDAVGNLQSLTYSNGVAHNYSYDAKNRLTNLGVTNGGATPTPIASYAYTVDNAGHRTGVTELSGRAVNYGYDNLYRLTNETISNDPNAMNGVVSYVYDAVGNRTQKVSTLPGYPGGLTNYNANDQIGTDTYDAEGNTTASDGNGYVYDFENHLLQSNGITYVYDGDGNRVVKTVAGVTTVSLVDEVNPTGYPQVVSEGFSGGQELSHTYIYGLERVTQERKYYQNGSQLQHIYYDYDGHGSVRALTDQSGTVTDTYDYDAFGNLIHSTGTSQNNFLFAGEQFDPDLNLYYNRARYLNTSTGRFWNMDSDEGDGNDPPSLHKYLYAESDPVDGIDPTGDDDIAELSAGFGISATLDSMPSLNFNQIVSSVKPETLYIRAFAPWKTFGFGFSGDNRGFTTSRDKSVTSRVTGIVKFLLPSAGILSSTAYSDPSHYGRRTKTGQPTISARSSGGNLHVSIAAANPLVPSADIDVNLDMSVQEKSGQACYAGHLYGDAFPDVEVFVVNREDQATSLDTFATNGGRQTGPYRYLPGDNNRPMGDFSKCTAE